MIRRYRLREYNFILVILLVLICTLGVLLVGSADASLQNKQLFGCIAGLILMVIISFVDYSWVLNFYWIIYAVNIGLLLLVFVSGKSAKGAARWIQIGGENGIQFQPTELSKILLILFFAMYFMKHENDINSFKTIVRAVVLIAVPLFFVFEQPDLKNTITICILFCILIYAAGLSYKIIGRFFMIVIPLAFVMVFLADLLWLCRRRGAVRSARNGSV